MAPMNFISSDVVKKLKKDDPNIKVKKVIVSINKNNGVFLRNFLKIATKGFMI